MAELSIPVVIEIVGMVGIILTMLFVGMELRRSNIESSLSNTREQVQMLCTFKSRTNDPGFADLVRRGRASFTDLSEAEKIAFALYLEEGIHCAMMLFLHTGRDVADRATSEDFAHRHLIAVLDHPGCRDWWSQNRDKSGVIDFGRNRVDAALAKG